MQKQTLKKTRVHAHTHTFTKYVSVWQCNSVHVMILWCEDNMLTPTQHLTHWLHHPTQLFKYLLKTRFPCRLESLTVPETSAMLLHWARKALLIFFHCGWHCRDRCSIFCSCTHLLPQLKHFSWLLPVFTDFRTFWGLDKITLDSAPAFCKLV